MPITSPYGTWSSPITPDSLVAGAAGISEVVPQRASVWWSESRPSEGGRTALMRWQDGTVQEMSPAEANIRTTVHEYGGGSWWVDNEIAFYVDYADQRLRSLSCEGEIKLLSPVPVQERGLRYADFRVTADGSWLIAVQEQHDQQRDEPENSIVAIATDGSLRCRVLAKGADFYGSPRISPDGSQLCWVQWDHPNMPWDDTQLMVANLQQSDSVLSLSDIRIVAGGVGEAVVQPEWSPGGQLHYLSDRQDLWHLYRDGSAAAVLKLDGDIGYPPWVFGLSRYAFKADGTVIAACYRNGIEVLDGFENYTAFHSIRSCGDNVSMVAAAWDAEFSVIFNSEVIRAARKLAYPASMLGAAETISYPSDGETAHALYFKPANPEFQAPATEKPPLIVLAHGGPTSQARSHLSLGRQFWTSRGFAVVDVNYRGSSGFGRRYRKKLEGQWGLVDVEDCVNAARYLVQRGEVDGERLIIRGGSAGGFTVLSALTFHDTFTAGANMYGVADLEALAQDTHKFESRYLDRLVGPYPESTELYQERSPIHHLQGFDVPLIVLQGSEDAIVPPNQSRMIVEALDKKGVPVAYLEFEGEQHGFRKAETIKQALLSELVFYGRVFSFDPADVDVTLDIRNLPT